MSIDSSAADSASGLPLPRAVWAQAQASQGRLEALAHAAAVIAGCPMAVIAVADGAVSRCLAQVGWSGADAMEVSDGCAADTSHKPPDVTSLLTHLRPLLTPANGFEVPDTLADAGFARAPWVIGGPRLRFVAGMALLIDGAIVGTLCVMNSAPRNLLAAQHRRLEGLAGVIADLLGQHRNRQALQEQSLRLHDLARASGDWMWELDAQLRYRWISGEFESVTGMPSQERIGQFIIDEPRLDAQGRSLPQAGGLKSLLERRQPFARAITAKATPRGTLYVSRSAMPVFAADGRFEGWRGTARNVTAQIQAEREAQLQHELLSKLSSQVPGIIFQYRVGADGQGRYLYASEGVRDLLGVPAPTRNGTAGMDDDLPFRLLHPDDAPGFRDSIAEAIRTLQPWSREYRIVRDDRSVRWLDTRASPERLADGSTLFHGFTADITDRKLAELVLLDTEVRWERAAAAAGIGLIEVNLCSGTMSLDRRACTVHGLAFPHAPLSLDDWLASVHDADRANVRRGVQRASCPGGHTEGRVRIVRPDSTIRHLEVACDARTEADGKVSALVGTCRDISDHIVNERLLRDKEAAERANQAKSQFLSRVSHELRTPLNSILGFAQLMELDAQHPLPPDQQRRLGGVQRAGSHLLDLIDEVLDLTRIERQDFQLPLQPVDIDGAIASSLRVLQPMAERDGIAMPAPTITGAWVQADGRALEQVLINLLSNAIKYNRPGGTVRLELELDASQARLSVIDEGSGLDALQQSQLFQPFNRLGAERRRVEGNGLGLVIARDLTLAMEGRLEVQSVPDSGSRFTVVLWSADGAMPTEAELLQDLSADASGESAGQPPEEGAAAFESMARTVLYIEDEPLNVVLMQEVFRNRAPWSLQVAVDGVSGLALARELQPHLLLIDMNLPDMSGLQVITQLRNDPATARLRCIAFSADAMQEQIETAMAAGFDAYWTKPIDLRRMIERLGEELATPSV